MSKDKKQVKLLKRRQRISGDKKMKTRVITLPFALYEWKEMPAITKTGKISKTRTIWEKVKVADEQEFQGFLINYRGKEYEIFVPTDNMKGFGACSWCCNEKGEDIKAIWKHGRYGEHQHEENALFNYEKERFIEVTEYCNGVFKDSYKYLVEVLF